MAQRPGDPPIASAVGLCLLRGYCDRSPLTSLQRNFRVFVDRHGLCGEELNERIEFRAHGKGYVGPFVSEPATSWAAPHLAGIAARLLSLRPGLKPFEVKTLLYWMSRPPAVRASRGREPLLARTLLALVAAAELPPPGSPRWSEDFCTSRAGPPFFAPTGLAPVERRLEHEEVAPLVHKPPLHRGKPGGGVWPARWGRLAAQALRSYRPTGASPVGAVHNPG